MAKNGKGWQANILRQAAGVLQAAECSGAMVLQVRTLAQAPIWDDQAAARVIAEHLDELEGVLEGKTTANRFVPKTQAARDPLNVWIDEAAADVMTRLLAALRGDV